MKILMIYWLLGCLLIGLAVVSVTRKCPNDHIPQGLIVEAVVVWPAILVVAWTGEHRPLTCDVPNAH